MRLFVALVGDVDEGESLLLVSTEHVDSTFAP